MKSNGERLVHRRVVYTLELEGRLYLIENVPARVNEETGEQYFAPQTVEKIYQTIHEKAKPDRIVETPVYHYVD